MGMLKMKSIRELNEKDLIERVQQMKTVCGNDSVLMEVWDHGDPLDSARNDVLVQIAHQPRHLLLVRM